MNFLEAVSQIWPCNMTYGIDLLETWMEDPVGQIQHIFLLSLALPDGAFF